MARPSNNQNQAIQKIKSQYGEKRFSFDKFIYTDSRDRVTIICNNCNSTISYIFSNLFKGKEPCEECRRRETLKENIEKGKKLHQNISFEKADYFAKKEKNYFYMFG